MNIFNFITAFFKPTATSCFACKCTLNALKTAYASQ